MLNLIIDGFRAGLFMVGVMIPVMLLIVLGVSLLTFFSNR